nr:uncharacterized protein LOC109154297 [Ipomoea batatas]
MGMKMSDARFLVVLMTVSLGMVMLSQDVVGDDAVYACLGGCYNKCFILSKQPPFETIVCFFKCFLTDCVSSGPPPANFVDSCGVGCSMQFCPLQSQGKIRQQSNDVLLSTKQAYFLFSGIMLLIDGEDSSKQRLILRFHRYGFVDACNGTLNL